MRTVIALVLALASGTALADGRYGPNGNGYYPPPPPQFAHPSRSCFETAIQLGYQTGSRYVGAAAVDTCRFYGVPEISYPTLPYVPRGLLPHIFGPQGNGPPLPNGPRYAEPPSPPPPPLEYQNRAPVPPGYRERPPGTRPPIPGSPFEHQEEPPQ